MLYIRIGSFIFVGKTKEQFGVCQFVGLLIVTRYSTATSQVSIPR